MTKRYRLGTVIFEEIGGGYYLASLPTRTIKLALFELLAMRATPINDKPECACEKTSNEWKMYSLNSDGQCIHCGRQIGPKPEKIEELVFAEMTDTIEISNKINEIIKAVNSLKGE